MLARASTGFHTRVGDSSWDTIWHARSEMQSWKAAPRDYACQSRKKPYTGPSLARGITYSTEKQGKWTWIVKASNGHGGYWTKGFAVADDFEDADATHVLTFHEACDAAKALARGKADAHHGDKP